MKEDLEVKSAQIKTVFTKLNKTKHIKAHRISKSSKTLVINPDCKCKNFQNFVKLCLIGQEIRSNCYSKSKLNYSLCDSIIL